MIPFYKSGFKYAKQPYILCVDTYMYIKACLRSMLKCVEIITPKSGKWLFLWEIKRFNKKEAPSGLNCIFTLFLKLCGGYTGVHCITVYIFLHA